MGQSSPGVGDGTGWLAERQQAACPPAVRSQTTDTRQQACGRECWLRPAVQEGKALPLVRTAQLARTDTGGMPSVNTPIGSAAEKRKRTTPTRTKAPPTMIDSLRMPMI